MSSIYRPICLNHTPPIVLDVERSYHGDGKPAPEPGHENCKIAIGRYSGALIELWLPITYLDRDGWHDGRWYDVSWMHRFPEVFHAILGGAL